ncbi:hypothetical protein HY492_02480 [Candidatus Woesearchaeota archaeon]|nr:hypothetical protein [Candidatus Woesearchaeota archaeon]
MGYTTSPHLRTSPAEVERLHTDFHQLQRVLKEEKLLNIARKVMVAGYRGDELAVKIQEAILALEGELRSGRRMGIDHHQYETIVKPWLTKQELEDVHKGFKEGEQALIQVALSDALVRWLLLGQQLQRAIKELADLSDKLLTQIAERA